MSEHDSTSRPLLDLARARFERRRFLTLMATGALATALPKPLRAKVSAHVGSTLDFESLPNRLDETIHVAAGYRTRVLIAFGDPVLSDAPTFDPAQLTASGARQQFGYGNDFVAFFPLPFGTQRSDRGLLAVNHETTEPTLMWPGVAKRTELDASQTEIEMLAQGLSVIEIARADDGHFARVGSSRFHRRLNAFSEMELTGPAAGDDRLKTSGDSSGTRVLGTFANCAGGQTPWGTVLSCEENFHKHFIGNFTTNREVRNFQRHNLDIENETEYGWGHHHPRFDVDREPNESYRFGWVVEIDPYDPHSLPKKRTALGRFKHEGATVALDPDGRVVVYSGDDDRFEYLYKFVSDGRYDENDRERNRDLLDAGTLFVARFEDDGSGRWIALVFGTNGLTPANDFHSPADVLIEARRAADIVGATPLDRPEDVEAHPVTGKVYVNLTNNKKRKPGQVDAANPRAKNLHGHILEITPPERSGRRTHAALDFRWEVFLMGGDPSDRASQARYHPAMPVDQWLSCPDNVTFDSRGRMWFTTDQGENQKANGIADGLRACDTEGDGRALPKLFFTVPVGAELCGPCFTPDERTLFVAVQHPGEGDHHRKDGKSSFEDPSTRWPDFDATKPPRPAIVEITRDDGGVIG